MEEVKVKNETEKTVANESTININNKPVKFIPIKLQAKTTFEFNVEKFLQQKNKKDKNIIEVKSK